MSRFEEIVLKGYIQEDNSTSTPLTGDAVFTGISHTESVTDASFSAGFDLVLVDD